MSVDELTNMKSIERFYKGVLASGVPSVVHFGVYVKVYFNYAGDLHQVFYEGLS